MSPQAERQTVQRSTRLWTIPNILCAIRLLGSPFLVLLAINDYRYAFVGLFIFLMLTDWLDGKIAILLDQRSVLGAKIDTWADATMYGGLLIGMIWLSWLTLRHDWGWIAALMLAYAVSIITSYHKFGAWPSYHTRSAKSASLLVLVGASLLILGDYVWPLRVAMVGLGIAILETIIITAVLPARKVNVPSVFHAWKQKHETKDRTNDLEPNK